MQWTRILQATNYDETSAIGKAHEKSGIDISTAYTSLHFYSFSNTVHLEAIMKHQIRFMLGLITLLLLVGCSSTGPERDINDPTNSLVFGYVNMDEAPTKAGSASILQVAPPTETPYWNTGVKDGLFFDSYLPPGSYQLASFYGSGFFAGEHRYSFPRQGNETSLRITKPGIYFLGAFKYKKVKTGFFEQGQFSIEKINKPTEAELLKRILDEYDDVKKSA